MTQTAPEPVAELWTYGGLRVGKDGRRLYAWLDPGGEELLFSRTGRMAVGSQYTVRVTRDGTVTMHGTPEYAGSAADEATRAPCGPRTPWRRPRLEALRAERSAARRNALDEALGPLLELAAPLRTTAGRNALAAYVIGKLHSTWGSR